MFKGEFNYFLHISVCVQLFSQCYVCMRNFTDLVYIFLFVPMLQDALSVPHTVIPFMNTMSEGKEKMCIWILSIKGVFKLLSWSYELNTS